MCPRVFGEAVVGGHRPEIGNAVQAEQHHRPPLLDGDPRRRHRTARGAPRPGCPPETSAPPRSATRYPASHRGPAAGAARCRARRAPHRGRAARPPPGRSALAASCAVKTRITGNTAGTARPVQHRGGVVAGRRGIGGNGVRLEPAGERAVPRRGHRQLAHHRRPFCGAKAVHSAAGMVTTFSENEKIVLEGGALDAVHVHPPDAQPSLQPGAGHRVGHRDGRGGGRGGGVSRLRVHRPSGARRSGGWSRAGTTRWTRSWRWASPRPGPRRCG